MRKGDLSILIPDGEEGNLALRVMCCLRRAGGFQVHILSRDSGSKARFSRYCTSFTHFDDTLSHDRIMEAISRTAKQVNARILLPVTEYGIRLVAARSKELEDLIVTSVPRIDAFDTAIDKWRLANFMQTHDIPTPHTILARADTEFSEHLDKLTFPVLLKPTRNTNGKGIRQFDDRVSLVRFLEDQRSEAFEYIIQNMVQGYDIDCSVVCKDGEILAYTIQKGIIPNLRRFSPPFAIEFLRHDEVLRVARKLLAALCWNGVAHLDMVVDEANGRVMVLELNARYWASLLGSLSAGVNFPYLAVIAGLGQTLPQVGYRHIRYIEPYAELKLLMRRPLQHHAERFRFSETGWRYLLADPLPFLAGKAIALWRSVK